jgi:hypothetical protein
MQQPTATAENYSFKQRNIFIGNQKTVDKKVDKNKFDSGRVDLSSFGLTERKDVGIFKEIKC